MLTIDELLFVRSDHIPDIFFLLGLPNLLNVQLACSLRRVHVRLNIYDPFRKARSQPAGFSTRATGSARGIVSQDSLSSDQGLTVRQNPLKVVDHTTFIRGWALQI